MSKNLIKGAKQTKTDVMASISGTPDLKSVSLVLTVGTLVNAFADTQRTGKSMIGK